MDNPYIDEMPHSIEEMREQFEQYKQHCQQEREKSNKLMENFKMDDVMKELSSNIHQLREDMNVLHKLQKDSSCCVNVDAIENLPSSLSNECTEDSSRGEEVLLEELIELSVMKKEETQCSDWDEEVVDQLKELNDKELEKRCGLNLNDIFEIVEDPLQEKQENDSLMVKVEQLLISCGSSPCLFENCLRCVDSQLLLLHYLSDHSEEDANFLHSYQIYKDQRIVLSFEPRRCQLKQNQVIGLLSYSSCMSPPCPRIYKSFLPRKPIHLQDDVPIVVLICKTSANILPLPKHQVFVIWLVTPHDKLQLTATLSVCGRDPAVQAKYTVGVRQVRRSQNESNLTPVDANHWRLSYDEIEKMSNGFRDELHLQVGITELVANSIN